MATVHFKPYSAVKYVGSKSKEHLTSLARPKPVLKKGDILIVDKRQASNMTTKGFGEFVIADDISFTKADVTTAEKISDLQHDLDEALKTIEALEGQIEDMQPDAEADTEADTQKDNGK